MGAHVDPVASVVAGLAVLLLGGQARWRARDSLEAAGRARRADGRDRPGQSVRSAGATVPSRWRQRDDRDHRRHRRVDSAVRGRPRIHRQADAEGRARLTARRRARRGRSRSRSVGVWARGSCPTRVTYVHAFLGATLTATSVGITARVFQDLGAVPYSGGTHHPRRGGHRRCARPDHSGRGQRRDRRGGAERSVLGDVSSRGPQPPPPSSWLARWSSAVTVAPRLFSVASLLQVRGVLVTVSLSLCFLLAWAASLIGLAPIVGAFAAGLVLEDVHFKDFVGRGRTLARGADSSDLGCARAGVLHSDGAAHGSRGFRRPGALELAAR